MTRVKEIMSERHSGHDLLGSDVSLLLKFENIIVFLSNRKISKKNFLLSKIFAKKNLKKIIVKRYDHTFIVFMRKSIIF